MYLYNTRDRTHDNNVASIESQKDQISKSKPNKTKQNIGNRSVPSQNLSRKQYLYQEAETPKTETTPSDGVKHLVLLQATFPENEQCPPLRWRLSTYVDLYNTRDRTQYIQDVQTKSRILPKYSRSKILQDFQDPISCQDIQDEIQDLTKKFKMSR